MELEKNNNSLSEEQLQIKVGDMFFNTESTYTYHPLIRIKTISLDEYKTITYEASSDWEGKKWGNYGSSSLNEFLRRYKDRKVIGSLEECLEEARKVISGEKSIDDYSDDQTISTENALLHVGSKGYMNALHSGLKEKEEKVRLVRESVMFEMERRRSDLEKIKDNLGTMLTEFRKKVSKLEDIIWTLELYLGINEQILQIKEGNKASENEVIFFRQQVLFMDEEVGDPEDDGIDFKRIEQFDEWIIKNINKILPEEKAIVVFKVRRSDKKYNDNPFINEMLNKDNKNTYILIRNGESIYRVWADIRINERLFPKKSELIDIQNIFLDEVEKHGEHYAEQFKEKLEDKITLYQRQLIMLQGLFDRTQVFQPYGDKITLMSAEIHESGRVKFIYDDEVKLPDSRVDFWTWHKNINNELKEGDRVILSSKLGKINLEYRLDKRFQSEYNKPELPKAGLYSVELYSEFHKDFIMIPNEKFDSTVQENWNNKKNIEKRDDSGKLVYNEYYKYLTCIRYNPGDIVYNLWGDYDDRHERKVRLSFIINGSDQFILNYDKVSIDDIDFYLNSRVNRRSYIFMMPLLYKIKQLKLEELKEEESFILMMKGDLMKVYKKDDIEGKIKDAISWWKLKNKWKRSLKSDDSKAYRMIRSRVINS